MNLAPGSKCTNYFREIYENRYTWEPTFKGYSGTCIWQSNHKIQEGTFTISSDLKTNVIGIKDSAIQKLITSQLWEVAIHRIRRSFNQTHSQNSFTIGDTDDIGTKIIVGGKNNGDFYRVKDKVITMVHRNIHGKLVKIYTKKIINTGDGYLSSKYSSQYFDSNTMEATSAQSHFTDLFEPLFTKGPWVLAKRNVNTESFADHAPLIQEFTFSHLKQLV